jgi:hypothetical protein
MYGVGVDRYVMYMQSNMPYKGNDLILNVCDLTLKMRNHYNNCDVLL